jgi:HEAT repeat protein
MTEPVEVPFQAVLSALLDAEKPLNPRFLYRLSDLEANDNAALTDAWPRLPLWRRQALLSDLVQLGAADLLLSFEAIGRIALQDADPQVRLNAVRLLSEYEATDLIAQFEHMLALDSEAEVRSAAAKALGYFVYAGELGELAESWLHEIENRLLQALQNDPATAVRRSALESLGYSSRAEVPALIKAAFASGDREWIASSLLAMGRSADEGWNEVVLEMLDHKTARVRTEAARAAGELEIRAATARLIELAEDGDEAVRRAAIWSLSQIGGEGVRAMLESRALEIDDDAELRLLEDALDNLAFTEGVPSFDLIDLAQKDLPTPDHLPDEDFLIYSDEEEGVLAFDLADDEADDESEVEIDIEAEVLALLDEEDEDVGDSEEDDE